MRAEHPGLKTDVAPQVEAIGDMVGVAQDLGLRREAFAPLPLLLQVVRELVRVLHALDVTARARVAVPVPGAADAGTGLEDPCPQTQAAGPLQHVQASEAGADDDQIDRGIGFGCVVRSGLTRFGFSAHEMSAKNG